MEERSRSAEQLAILFLSHRNPIPEPVLGLRLFDSYAVCYGKLYPRLDYLRHWLREPNHQALFSEDNVREFDRLFSRSPGHQSREQGPSGDLSKEASICFKTPSTHLFA